MIWTNPMEALKQLEQERREIERAHRPLMSKYGAGHPAVRASSRLHTALDALASFVHQHGSLPGLIAAQGQGLSNERARELKELVARYQETKGSYDAAQADLLKAPTEGE